MLFGMLISSVNVIGRLFLFYSDMKTKEQVQIMLNMEIERKKLAKDDKEREIFDNRISILRWVLNN